FRPCLHLVPERIEAPGKVGEGYRGRRIRGEETFINGEPMLPPVASHVSLHTHNTLCNFQ
ncbi:hypothetical protein KI387_018397, partial [Taxus chinensis]